MNFQDNANLDELVKFYLPQDSTVTSVNITERFGSIFAEVHHTVSNSYKEEHSLSYSNRILAIRLIKGEGDKGLAISSFVDSTI